MGIITSKLTTNMTRTFLELLQTPNGKLQIGEANTVFPEPYDLNKIVDMEANVYFLTGVNATKTGRAKDSDVVEKNYMAFDFDLTENRGWSPEQVKTELQAAMEFLLEDSRLGRLLAVVFSGGGGHLYYRTPLITDFRNWRVAYRYVQEKLEAATGWKADSACSNPARIMRLPGSKNVKRGVRTELLYLNPDVAELFVYADYEHFKQTTPKKVTTTVSIPLDRWDSKSMRTLSNKKMLELLSGTPLVDKEVFTFRPRPGGGEYIDVNGEPADAWLDAEGKIGSGKGGGPTWLEWVKFYGTGEKEVNQFLFDSGVVTFDEPESEGYEIDRPVKVFTWGTPRLDSALSPIRTEQSNLLTGATSAGKTTFAFDVAWKNAELGHKVLYLSLEMSRKEIETRLARAFAGINKEEWRDPVKISSYKRERFKARVDELKSLKTLILSGMSGTPPTTENVFKLIRLINPDLVFLDNFDLIQKQQGKSQYEEENRISAELKEFPKQEQIPIIILHHRGKKGAGNIDGVRGSGKITHDRYTALRCEREYNEDSSDEENAKFYLVEEKDRDFGHGKRTTIYFKFGSFYDTF